MPLFSPGHYFKVIYMKLLLPLVMTDKQQAFILDGNVLLLQTGKLLSVELL